MPTLQVSGFGGIDLRKLPETGVPGKLRIISGNNVSLLPGDSIAARDQIKPFATVDSRTLGLYAIGKELHVAFPQPDAVVPRPPAGMAYDVFKNQATIDGAGGTATEFANAVTWEGRPYICIGRTLSGGGKVYEHHYLQSADTIPVPVTASGATLTVVGPVPPSVKIGATVYFAGLTDTVPHRITNIVSSTITISPATTLTSTQVAMIRPYANTKVSLPFAPGRALALIGAKIYANDIDTNNVPFSSTINGPTDWTNVGDAGYLDTATNVGGGQSLTGIGVFNGKALIFYDKTVQVWNVYADPVNNELVGSVGGAGTEEPRSVANVMGDVYYFSQGGFRSVASVITTGQLKPDDVGAPIYPLTKTFDWRTQDMIAGWSEARSQYYAIVGQTVYVFTLSPTSDTRGWTTWTLPWSVSDAVELDGKLYMRKAGTGEIWVMDPAATGESGFAWDATFAFLDAETFRQKQWTYFIAQQSGDATWEVATDPSNITASLEPIATVNGSMANIGPVLIGNISRKIAFKASGDSAFSLDGFEVEFTAGNYV